MEDKNLHQDADKWIEFVSILIHDIESPLVSVKYVLKLVDDGKLDMQRAVHRKLVASSRVAIERAESIIWDIMAVAKAGRVGLPVNMMDVDHVPIIENGILLASGGAEDRGVTVTYAEEAGNTLVRADPKLLVRVIDNLLYNAVRHTPSGESVKVYTENGDEWLSIHVKDSGPGLGNGDHEVLFTKYSQLKARDDGQHRGVGLGLYFCRLAANGMGGTIMARDHPGGGAVFSIELQKAKE